ncbi:hypothetical protein CC77DRAFT_138304 [Alternaria alternata]|uniref:Uncharacterized protein n=1 Tax=Alternaria alternata TaxID=5599 RepID=A0A177DJ92_ALTAL|nr:hypothetical protein CC77DRAFT_138304 [Alternaria alternata]OAG19765.1 hypothetical protein CC77DRAFT_138304 [Alternaria alternata]
MRHLRRKKAPIGMPAYKKSLVAMTSFCFGIISLRKARDDTRDISPALGSLLSTSCSSVPSLTILIVCFNACLQFSSGRPQIVRQISCAREYTDPS